MDFQLWFKNTCMRLSTPFLILLCINSLAVFAFSYFNLFLKEQGFSLASLVLLYALTCVVAVLIIPFLKSISLRWTIPLGFLNLALISLAVTFSKPTLAYLLYASLVGLHMALFWVSLNYFFFTSSCKATNAVDSTLYSLAPSIITAILPLAGARFLHAFGYRALFGLTAVLLLLSALILRRRIPHKKITLHFLRDVKEFKSLRTITCCEGALQFFTYVLLPIYGLLFLKSEIELGWFFSYLAVVGLIIALILSFRSDKTQLRKKYVYPLFFLCPSHF